jgi:hypothetical protein
MTKEEQDISLSLFERDEYRQDAEYAARADELTQYELDAEDDYDAWGDAWGDDIYYYWYDWGLPGR